MQVQENTAADQLSIVFGCTLFVLRFYQQAMIFYANKLTKVGFTTNVQMQTFLEAVHSNVKYFFSLIRSLAGNGGTERRTTTKSKFGF